MDVKLKRNPKRQVRNIILVTTLISLPWWSISCGNDKAYDSNLSDDGSVTTGDVSNGSNNSSGTSNGSVSTGDVSSSNSNGTTTNTGAINNAQALAKLPTTEIRLRNEANATYLGHGLFSNLLVTGKNRQSAMPFIIVKVRNGYLMKQTQYRHAPTYIAYGGSHPDYIDACFDNRWASACNNIAYLEIIPVDNDAKVIKIKLEGTDKLLCKVGLGEARFTKESHCNQGRVANWEIIK